MNSLVLLAGREFQGEHCDTSSLTVGISSVSIDAGGSLCSCSRAAFGKDGSCASPGGLTTQGQQLTLNKGSPRVRIVKYRWGGREDLLIRLVATNLSIEPPVHTHRAGCPLPLPRGCQAARVNPGTTVTEGRKQTTAAAACDQA